LRRLTPILAILLLAAVTRIVNAGHFPVWTDEGFSTYAASDHRLNVILDRVVTDRHPPLYFLTLSAWWEVAGYSRIALRFLAIAAGLLTVAATYRIGADWFGRQAGIYAALLLSLLDVAIYYSQEIRHYSWLMLAISLMTLFFLRYLRHPRHRTLVYYTLSVTFMLYTLYIGVLILAVQVFVGLLLWRGSRRQKRNLLLAWIAALVLYSPWLIAMSQQLHILAGGIDGYPTTWETLITLAGILLGGQIALMAGLYALGVWRIVDQRDSSIRWLAQVTIVLCGAGLFFAMFFGNLYFKNLSARTMVYLTPMLMIICGYGLSLIERRPRQLLTAALVVVSLSTTDFVQPRLDSNVAAQALATEYTQGDLIILENGWDDNAVRYEIMLALPDGEQAEIIRTLPWVSNRFQNLPVVPQVEGEIKAHRRVWVVNWLDPAQVVPFLDGGGDGFVRVLTRETPTGAQYKDLYTDQMMRVILFERPDTSGKVYHYSDLLALRDTLIAPDVTQGSALHVDLWWSALKPLPLDYSVGVFLLDDTGKVIVQHDGPPGDQPTTQWLPDTLKFDRHTLTIPATLAPGIYRLGVQVYWYGDNKPLPVDNADYAIVGQITVKG
jgi:hypothetical protein